MTAKRWRILILFFVVIIFAAGTGFAGGVVYDRFVLVPQTMTHSVVVPNDATSNFRLIVEAWNTIQKNYVDRDALKNATTLTYGAISGMVDALGDTGHSRFMSPETVKSEQSLTTGQFEGIGAEVQMKNQQVVIVAPIAGSPAEKAGVKPGDIILKVDGTDISGMTLDAVVTRIKGPAGTQVTITLQDPDTGKVTDLKITRAKVNLVSI
jgi:carboxyl-terminal processing protease